MTGTVIFQSNTPGSYTKELLANNCYEIVCVGGGGGGSWTSGGAGACWIGVVKPINDVTLNITVGAGGAGGESYVRNHCGTKGDFSFIECESISILCEGGNPGMAARGYNCTCGLGAFDARHGYSTVPVTNLTVEHQLVMESISKFKQSSWIDGSIYGQGANGGSSGKGIGISGENGFVKITQIETDLDTYKPTENVNENVGNVIDIPHGSEVYTTVVTNETFQGESRLASVDLNNRPVQDKDLEEAFLSCIRLETVKNVSDVTNLDRAFYNCTNLKNVPTIPIRCNSMNGTFQNCINLNSNVSIPPNVTNIDDCFNGCKRLALVPTINNNILTSAIRTFKNTNVTTVANLPNSVTDMTETYSDCKSIERVNKFPTSVQTLEKTFYNCSNLKNISAIPESVTNLKQTFYNCDSLVGKIIINSPNVTNAEDCFYLPNSVVQDRDVYLPIPSTSYNSFVTAGYSRTIRKHGVLLVPLGYHFVKIRIQGDEKEIEDAHAATVKVNGVICRTMLDTHENGICISGCEDDVFYALVQERTNYTITVTLDGFNNFEHTYSMSTADQNITVVLTPTAPVKSTLTVSCTVSGSSIVLTLPDKTTKTGNPIQIVEKVGQQLTFQAKFSAPNYIDIYRTIVWNTNNNYDYVVNNLDYRPDYAKGQIIYESNNDNETATINLYKDYIYELTCVGGGAGSSNGYGGAGAIWVGEVYVDKNTIINTVTGHRGAPAGGYCRNHCGGYGGNSTITGNDISIIGTGGNPGIAARGYNCSCGLGAYSNKHSLAKAPSFRSSFVTIIKKTNNQEYRQESYDTGTNHGKGANGGYNGKGIGGTGFPGYIRIKYLDEMYIPPIPIEPDDDYDGQGTTYLQKTSGQSGSDNKLTLPSGLYRITMVGGGGGSIFFISPTDNDLYYKATGGSGSGFKGTFYLPEGTYCWSVGTGGASAQAPGSVTNGGDTKLYIEGTAEENIKLIAYGGEKGSCNTSGVYTGGKAGKTPKTEETCYEMVFKSAGKAGLTDSSTSKTLTGGASIFKSTIDGNKSERGTGGKITNGSTVNGTNGYLKIVKLS